MTEQISPRPPSDGVRITVSGSAHESFPPQRCTVHLQLAHEGPVKQAVYEATVRTLSEVRAQVSALYDAERGPVMWWSADQVYNSQHRPFNNEGKQLPFVYSAAATVAVKFADLSRVAAFVGEVAERDGVSVSRLDWTLTRVTLEQKLVSIRDAAVRDAVARAWAYASSLGLPSVSAVELSEPGLRQTPEPRAYKAAMMAGGLGQPELELRPQDIAVSAAVEAVFLAS